MITRGTQIHHMKKQYWPYTWQRLWVQIELLTNTHDCRETYRCTNHDLSVMEFRSMDEMDTYARAIHRIDLSNNEENRDVDGSYPAGYYRHIVLR